MSKNVEFTTADVYEHATSIGKDIEYIINEYGNDIIEDLMPKIIFLLEQLERTTESLKLKKEQYQELTIEKEQLLIHTKRDEAIQRQLEEKLSYVESLLSSDSKELQYKIRSLQQENDFLSEEMSARDDEIIKLRTAGGPTLPWLLWLLDCCLCGNRIEFLYLTLPGDIEVMVRMKTTIDSQRDQLRMLNGDVISHKRELEALQEHVDRLTDVNEQLRTNNYKLNAALKVSGSDEIDNGGYEASALDLTNSLKKDILNSSLSDELSSVDRNYVENYYNGSTSTDDELDPKKEEVSSNKQKEDSINKKDPNRPRYTLQEMSKVLEERNMFKIKLTALEDEVSLLRERTPSDRSLILDDDSELKKDQSGVRSFMQRFLGKN